MGLLALFSFLLAAVFAALLRDDVHEQLRFGGVIFAGLVVSAILLGWLMSPFPL